MNDEMIKVKRRIEREDGYGTYHRMMSLRPSRIESVCRSAFTDHYDIVMVSGEKYTVLDFSGVFEEL